MEPVSYIFTPGIDSTIYLPINGSESAYTAKLDLGTSGAVGLSACYDQYGALWKWSTFERDSLSGINGLSGLRVAVLSAKGLLNTTRVAYPSSWSTVQCTVSAGSNTPTGSIWPNVAGVTNGIFSKKWRNLTTVEAASASISQFDFFNINTRSVSSAGIYWSLSTANWTSDTQFVPLSVSNEYNFVLQMLNYGTTEYTTSFFEDTPITLNARLTATSMDPLGNVSATFISQSFDLTAIAPPSSKIYTPNRYVLTGTDIKFENLLTKSNLVNSLTANCDDGKVIILTGTNVTNDFTVSYDVVGYKTITITVDLNKNVYDELAAPIVTTFPNIIQVLSRYDDVSVENYISTTTPIQLPWPNQPHVGINDWVIEDNINSAFRKFYDNLNYLDSLGRIYPGTYSDYYGYLGIGAESTITGNTTAYSPWTWEDVDCLNTALPYNAEDLTWRSMLSAINPFDNGKWVIADNATWNDQACGSSQIDPSCTGKYCVQWNWRARKAGNTLTPITWKQTKSTSGEYPKRWYFEPCSTEEGSVLACDEGYWNVNIPKLDTFYNEQSQPAIQLRCMYNGVASKNNVLFLAQKTQIKVLKSDYTAGVQVVRARTGNNTNFSNIKNICLDSAGKVYVLDSILSQVFVYDYPDVPSDFIDSSLFTVWGGFGSAGSTTKFSNPNDIHVDQLDNVWICDTGNSVVKHYSNTGTWLKTIRDDEFKTFSPISLTVDSQQNVHVLTSNGIRVYTYNGIFSYSYSYNEFVSANEPVKINASYNKEIIYVAFKTQVLKFFRTGVFAGYIIQSKQYVDNITGLYHDEYRNLLITVNDRVYKYPDLMLLRQLKGTLPSSYWKLEDLLIHKEEYVQNWVYTKSFQRLWDNIEIFRNTLQYSTGNCKSYTLPIHGKDKMIIGQNEIVTSTVVNRVLGYLWENFYSMVKYFDPSCEN
jgi:hypothetical protein